MEGQLLKGSPWQWQQPAACLPFASEYWLLESPAHLRRSHATTLLEPGPPQPHVGQGAVRHVEGL